MKAFLGVTACLFAAAQFLRGPPVSDLDRLVLAVVGALAIRAVGALHGAIRRGSRGPAAAQPLDTVLFEWSPDDPFTLGELCRNVAIFGQTGSGKTSGSGYQLGRAIVRHRKSGGLILASKPE